MTNRVHIILQFENASVGNSQLTSSRHHYLDHLHHYTIIRPLCGFYFLLRFHYSTASHVIIDTSYAGSQAGHPHKPNVNTMLPTQQHVHFYGRDNAGRLSPGARRSCIHFNTIAPRALLAPLPTVSTTTLSPLYLSSQSGILHSFKGSSPIENPTVESTESS